MEIELAAKRDKVGTVRAADVQQAPALPAGGNITKLRPEPGPVPEPVPTLGYFVVDLVQTCAPVLSLPGARYRFSLCRVALLNSVEAKVNTGCEKYQELYPA